jgi:hypothetical protein
VPVIFYELLRGGEKREYHNEYLSPSAILARIGKTEAEQEEREWGEYVNRKFCRDMASGLYNEMEEEMSRRGDRLI